jgi:HEAT repeat protein
MFVANSLFRLSLHKYLMTTQNRPIMLNGTSIPYSSSFKELCVNLESPGPLAWASLVALGYQETELAFQKLLELSQSPDWRFRRGALEALAFHSGARDIQNVLKRALNDTSPYIIRIACKVIGDLKLSGLHDNIVTLFKSQSAIKRDIALRTLNDLWRETDFPIVFHIFLSDRNESVRREAAWVIRAHPTHENWLELFQNWQQDPLARHRRWACELASDFGASKVEEELRKLSCDSDGHVRKAANKALELILS